MYEQRLGLSFIHNAAAGQLEVVYSQIDPAQPQRQFSIAIRLLPDERYEGNRKAIIIIFYLGGYLRVILIEEKRSFRESGMGPRG